MAAFKIALCVVVLVSLASAEDVSLRQATNMVVEKPLVEPKETRATVISTNLSANDAKIIANDVQSVYNSISGTLNRAVGIQNKLKQRFPSLSNNVIINFAAAAYYQRYYVNISVNGQYVLCFGL